ncbi:MAG TPA: aminotransferase class V-fold PLP-dependent enzyme [Herpetosiphonaceae bacterium]|nr:aminotransferase class V-fold PLP-dependent enzyme [Herpetosiphonaceae bacterium]
MTPVDSPATHNFAVLRQEQFPVAERYVYLNHAALGPLPRRAADAVAAVAGDFRDRGMLAERTWLPAVTRTRALLARLLHVAPGEIAFTKNTSQGLGIVAASVPWKPGDVIVTVRGEFPANVYPWLALQQAGVQVRFVQPRQGRIMLADLNHALDGAKMLAISWVQYSNGFRVDLGALSELCHRRGVLLCLDAIQGAGALPLDLQDTPVDFCAFGGHKWMLAPQGIGVLYVNPRVRDLLRPANVGWMGVAWQNYTAFDYDTPLLEGAPRYEEGTRSLLGIAGLEQSLGLLLEVGPANIAARLATLTEHLAQRLLARGYQLSTPLLPVERSGILTFFHGQRSAHELWDRLRAARIVAAVREGGVRLSPHLYNTVDEMDAVVDALEG